MTASTKARLLAILTMPMLVGCGEDTHPGDMPTSVPSTRLAVPQKDTASSESAAPRPQQLPRDTSPEQALNRVVALAVVGVTLDEALPFLTRATGLRYENRAKPEELVRFSAEMPTARWLKFLSDRLHLDAGLEDGTVVFAEEGTLNGAVQRFDEIAAKAEASHNPKADLRRRWGVTMAHCGVRGVIDAINSRRRTEIIKMQDAVDTPITIKMNYFDFHQGVWWLAYLSGNEAGLEGKQAIIGRKGTLGQAAGELQRRLPPSPPTGTELIQLRWRLMKNLSCLFNNVPLVGVADAIARFAQQDVTIQSELAGFKGGPEITLRLLGATAAETAQKTAETAGAKAGWLHGAIFIAKAEEISRLGAVYLDQLMRVP